MSLNPEQVVANNNTPIAVINLSGNSTTVSPGSPITFDGSQSYDPDNTNIIAYNWWYVDGVVKSQGSTADKKIFSYTFTLPAGVNSKTYQIKLTVRDNEYITASKTLTVTVTRSGRTEYYLTDHLGSIRTTIDQNGTVIGFDDYDPFGNVLPGRSYNAGTPHDLNKFTGVERDTEGNINLDAFGRRLYDPELGRFYGVDRFHFKYPSLNPFQYAANDPINKFDVNGDSIVVLLQYDAAAGAGHMAVLTQRKDGKWVYQSKNGGTLLASGETRDPEDGSKTDDTSQELVFDSIEAFANSDFNLDEEENARYNEALLFPTDPKDGDALISATSERVQANYALGSDDCSHAAQTPVRNAGFNDGSTTWKPVSHTGVPRTGIMPVSNLTPKAKFREMKKSNPTAIDATNRIKRN